MGKHTLDGGVTVDVAAVEANFGARPPDITGVGRERMVSFSKPKNVPPMATIKFKFRATGRTSDFMFGVKQICTQKSYQALYVGLKDEDGSISQETRGFDDVPLLDISANIDPLLDAQSVATGARAIAPQAPFFSETLANVRAGSDIELSVADHPGSNFRSELQNGATDRPNYLDRVRMRFEFVTALVAVQFQSGAPIAHIPIEGVRWSVRSFARVAWNANAMTLQEPKHEAVKLADLPTISADSEFDIFRDRTLTAADCILQKFNDGLFAAQAALKRQDYNHPTGRLTTIGPKGVIYIQFPVVAN